MKFYQFLVVPSNFGILIVYSCRVHMIKNHFGYQMVSFSESRFATVINFPYRNGYGLCLTTWLRILIVFISLSSEDDESSNQVRRRSCWLNRNYSKKLDSCTARAFLGLYVPIYYRRWGRTPPLGIKPASGHVSRSSPSGATMSNQKTLHGGDWRVRRRVSSIVDQSIRPYVGTASITYRYILIILLFRPSSLFPVIPRAANRRMQIRALAYSHLGSRNFDSACVIIKQFVPDG